MFTEDFSGSDEEWMKNQFACLELFGTPTELRKNLNFQSFLSKRDKALHSFKENQKRALERWATGN